MGPHLKPLNPLGRQALRPPGSAGCSTALGLAGGSPAAGPSFRLRTEALLHAGGERWRSRGSVVQEEGEAMFSSAHERGVLHSRGPRLHPELLTD